MSNQEAQKLTQSANILTAIKDRSTVIHNKVWNTAWRLSAIYSLFLASCGPKPETTNQPEALPTNTGEPPQVEFSPTLEEIILTPTSALEPTTIPTETPTPTETIALPPPTEAWMGEFLANKEGYDYSFENGQWLMRSKPLTNGKTIDMFTFANGEWQPTYDTLPNHVNEYFGLDLEAVAHQFVRYELTTDNKGNSIRTLNPDDLDNLRALAETRWEERKDELGSFRLIKYPGVKPIDLSINGSLILEKLNSPLSATGEDERWEVLAAASTGSHGKESLLFLGSKQGLIPVLLVTENELWLRSTELSSLTNNSSNILIENPDLSQSHYISAQLLLGETVNPNTAISYTSEDLDYIFSYVRGLPSLSSHSDELSRKGYNVELEEITSIISKNNLIFVSCDFYNGALE